MWTLALFPLIPHAYTSHVCYGSSLIEEEEDEECSSLDEVYRFLDFSSSSSLLLLLFTLVLNHVLTLPSFGG